MFERFRRPKPRRRDRSDIGIPTVVPPLRKEAASCCLAHALPDGRLPIGFCSPDCRRRIVRDHLLNGAR